MKWRAAALLLGFLLDCIFGDPGSIPHPVVGMGKLISLLEKAFRRVFPKTETGEKIAGGLLWLCLVLCSGGLAFGILWLCRRVSPWLSLAAEGVMCWQLLAAKSLKAAAMSVHTALKTGDLDASRHAVSMIVGRDTARLDENAITRAAVETVAENTSDGVIAPMLYFAIGGAPLAFVYKAVNTMDSMLGYVEPPYKHIGLVPARMDDVFNLIPSRLSALLMLLAGIVLRLNVKNGWKIFRRDRYNHASPNSAQTESVCAGLLGLRLAGDASYHGVLHKKPYIGDALREIEPADIPRSCRLMYVTTVMMFAACFVTLLFL